VEKESEMSDRDEPHACPYCDLVFKYHGEVVDHIRHDHPSHAGSVADIEPRELPHD
jgi:uncharacterized C2H2 Zn-finger protein